MYVFTLCDTIIAPLWTIDYDSSISKTLIQTFMGIQ